MKRILNYLLMAVTVCGLSLAVTSCKDDDKDNGDNGGASAEELAADNANTFWSVAANLVSPLDATADYENKTFEPTIGEADGTNNTVRVVVMPDVEAAAAHFAAIVDADMKAGTATYTYKNDAVGTLTYTKSTDGKSLAKVDVSIKQIPHLQQIVYKTAEQMGTNAVTDGIPYYWFGDVISRLNEDAVPEYWICIQAPFTKQGNTDAVWASVSKLPSKNVFQYTSKAGKLYKVPYNIGNNKEYMKSLAELIFAMYNPDKWEQNIEDGPDGIKAFNFVKKENLQYINKNFWKVVGNIWDNKSLDEAIFNAKLLELYDYLTANNGLKLLYHGYSWWTKVSNNLTLYESTITTGTGKEANGRHLEWKEVTKNVINPYIQVECMGQLEQPNMEEGVKSKWINEAFFGDANPRYIFRFATTRELAGRKITPWESMEGKYSIKDVYRFADEMKIETGEKQHMDDVRDMLSSLVKPISVEEAQVGKIIAADGTFCDTEDEAEDNHNGALAVVVYVGDDMRVEEEASWNGLAISLKGGTADKKWMAIRNDTLCSLNIYLLLNEPKTEYNGIYATNHLVNKCKTKKHDHEAAKYCYEYNPKLNNRGAQFSPWFLPSNGQWLLAVKGIGGEVSENGIVKISEQRLIDLGLLDLRPSLKRNFWTTTQSDNDSTFVFNTYDVLTESKCLNTTGQYVLPFIAFKYGAGGREDQEREDYDFNNKE